MYHLSYWRGFPNWGHESQLSLGWSLACWCRRRVSCHDRPNLPVRNYLLDDCCTITGQRAQKMHLREQIANFFRSEIAHPSIRGRVTALQQFMLGIGSFVAGWVSYGTYIGLTTTAQWRVPLGLQMIPAVGLAALILFFPESPR